MAVTTSHNDKRKSFDSSTLVGLPYKLWLKGLMDPKKQIIQLNTLRVNTDQLTGIIRNEPRAKCYKDIIPCDPLKIK